MLGVVNLGQLGIGANSTANLVLSRQRLQDNLVLPVAGAAPIPHDSMRFILANSQYTPVNQIPQGAYVLLPNRVDGPVPTVDNLMYEPTTFVEFLRSTQPSPSLESLALLDQINLYEAIIVVIACHAVLQSLPPDRQEHLTIFVWCDNTSAIAWLTNNKSNHPTINFLLQVWARLQANHNCTINCGHFLGILNIVPEAISRQFKVPHGSEIQAALSHLTPHQSLPLWFTSMLQCSITPSQTAWQTAAAALTALASGL